MGSGGIAPTLFTSALDGGEWLASFLCRFTAGERARGTHWIGGWNKPKLRTKHLSDLPEKITNCILSSLYNELSARTDRGETTLKQKLNGRLYLEAGLV
jgi:hypothetical protein